MAAAEVEGMLVVGGMDCVVGLRMVVVEVVGSPGCTDPGLNVHLAAGAETEAADLVRL